MTTRSAAGSVAVTVLHRSAAIKNREARAYARGWREEAGGGRFDPPTSDLQPPASLDFRYAKNANR
jgi:hypothetical protein